MVPLLDRFGDKAAAGTAGLWDTAFGTVVHVAALLDNTNLVVAVVVVVAGLLLQLVAVMALLLLVVDSHIHSCDMRSRFEVVDNTPVVVVDMPTGSYSRNGVTGSPVLHMAGLNIRLPGRVEEVVRPVLQFDNVAAAAAAVVVVQQMEEGAEGRFALKC